MGSDETMTEWYLAVDPGEGATTVAIGPATVADLNDIIVRVYRSTEVEEAVRRLLRDLSVDAEDVLCAALVVEPGATKDKAVEEHVRTALGHGPVMFIDRVETALGCHLAGVPVAAASAAAVLTIGVGHRGERRTLDLSGAEALFAADPACFERWAIGRLGGIVADDLEDRGIDGVLWCPGWNTWESSPLLVVVKGGDHHDARTVADLAAAVRALDVAGGVLVYMDAPPPEVYEAAQRLGASPQDHGQDGVPLVQVLTIPELLNGRQPVGLDDGEP